MKYRMRAIAVCRKQPKRRKLSKNYEIRKLRAEVKALTKQLEWEQNKPRFYYEPPRPGRD